MPFAGEWCKVWIYFGFVFAWTKGARPRFDTSTDMGLVLIPADAEVDSVIFRLRATDQDADFPLVFEITATITPVVRIDNLPCTLYNKVCQANVILTKRLVPGRLHDFAVRVRDTKGDSNSMQATISVTNATTPRDKIFPHIPSLIMVPENTKPGKELDYLLVRANSWSGKPVYIELWQPKELFTIRQRQTPTQTRGVITLIGELDFETQSMYTLTMYATDPYTEPGKDTRNIAGLSVVVIVQDVQDVPPIFTLAPPLTRINNSVQPGDIILRVHAEDGDKGVPREIVYGLVSEGNPFTPCFNISETSGEIVLARPLEELTQITHVGAPVVLTVVAEEIRRSREEPPAQATVVDVGFLLGEPGNSPPYFESDNYVATIDENPEPGTLINFGEQYLTKVKDEDIGKAGVFALKLENNNGTFEISPTVAERTADFIISVRDNTLIDYELHKDLSFKIVAQEVGPATNLSTTVPVTIHLRDINDNPPVFEEEAYEVTLSENVTAGSRVVQVHATDRDTGVYGSIRYTNITGEGSEAFTMEPDTGLITVSMGSTLDREIAAKLVLTVEARDENGNGNRGVVPLMVNLLDVNDNAPIFEKDTYEFTLNADLTNFTSPAIIKAIDGDAEPPNNVVRYELVHGNYENKFYLNETSGELTLRSPISKIRRKKQSVGNKISKTAAKNFAKGPENELNVITRVNENETSVNSKNKNNSMNLTRDIVMQDVKKRRKRADDDALYTLTARAYDLGVPHLSSVTKIRIIGGATMEARIMMFVVPGEQPDSTKTAETLAAITGGRVTVLETRPYIQQNHTGNAGAIPAGGKKSIIVARVEQTETGTSLVDVEKIREALAANGVGIIGGADTIMNTTTHVNNTIVPVDATPRSTIHDGQTIITNNTFASVHNEEVTVYKAENKLLFWLLIILGLLILLAIAVLIVCCICPGCPFYMAPRKRRVHSSETLVVRTDGRPRRHLHRQPATIAEVSWNGRKQAWSADPTRRNWQFNKRNVKNCSLPGDVAYISRPPNNAHVYLNTDAQQLRDGPSYGHSRRSRMNEEDRIYMEDVEAQKGRSYDTADIESLHQHEMERGSDMQREAYKQRYIEPEIRDAPTVREHHFFREGNAEVLRLVTRGQVEDTTTTQVHHHRPTTLIVDGKDIILQRFIEDQNSRQELSVHDPEAPRSMESHHRGKEPFQQPPPQPEIILIPDRLELGHRQHIEEIGPNVQRLVIDHGDYDSQKIEKESQMRDSLRQTKRDMAAGEVLTTDRPTGAVNKEYVETSNAQYSLHGIELARQNALLTRLLLDREQRRAGGGGGMDSTSYLETQSLPGQVAIATQTDRSAATQTERQPRSRSDNDESDEESRHRKKLKSRKKHGDGDWRRAQTLWMKSPIQEEGSPRFDKRLRILRKKVKEAKEGRQGSLEPEVLREISDSLEGNGSSNKGDDDETGRRYRKAAEQATSIGYKMLKTQNESQSSEERQKGKLRKSNDDMTDDQKTNATESTSSSEIKVQREKHSHEKISARSPMKDGKSKMQKKFEKATKPSFMILEKEFSSLTKKLSKLGEKKCRESTGSDSTSQEKSEDPLKGANKEVEQKDSKKVDDSGDQKQTVERTTSTSKMQQKGKQKKVTALLKGKQKLKHQQTPVMSTGSSEIEDTHERSKKLAGPRQESVKQKGHLKLKRVVQGDRREIKKQVQDICDEYTEKRKDKDSKEMSKVDVKQEKMEKERMTSRIAKLTTLSRRNVIDEDSIENKMDETRVSTSANVSGGRESNTELSEKESSNELQQRRTFEKKMVQEFSDDFVEQGEGTERKTVVLREEDAMENKISEVGQLMKDKRFPEAIGDMSMKKITDDLAYLKSGQQSITSRKVNVEIVTKDEQFIDDSKTQEDKTITAPIQTEKDFINTAKARKLDDKSIKSADIVEPNQNDDEKIEEYEQKDMSTSEIESGVAKLVQDEKVKAEPPDDVKQETESKPEESLHKREQANGGDLNTIHTQHIADKISRDVETKSEPIDHAFDQIQDKRDVSDDVKDVADKSDIVQETEIKFSTEIFAGNSKNGGTDADTVKTSEAFIQQDKRIETQSADQSGISKKSTDKSETREVEFTIYPSNKHEEKPSMDLHMDQVVEEKEKQDTKKTMVREHEIPVDVDTAKILHKQEAILSSEDDEVRSMETILPKEEKQYDDESKKLIIQAQISRNAITDENMKITDEKQTITGNKTVDQTTTKETSDEKIIEDIIDSTKDTKKSIQDPAIVEHLSEDHQSVGGIIKDSTSIETLSDSHKILEQPISDHKIIEEPINGQTHSELSNKDIKGVEKDFSKDHKTDEQLIEDNKFVEQSIEDRAIPKESSKSLEVVDESAKDYKTSEEQIQKHEVIKEATEIRTTVENLTDDHVATQEPPESPKMDSKPIEDHEIIKEPIKDSEIPEKTVESPKIVEKSNEDHKIIEQSSEEYKIVKDPTKTLVSVEDSTEDYTVNEDGTEGNNISKKIIEDQQIIEASTDTEKAIEIVNNIKTIDREETTDSIIPKELRENYETTLDTKVDTETIIPDMGENLDIADEMHSIDFGIDQKDRNESATFGTKEVSHDDTTATKESTIIDEETSVKQTIVLDKEKEIIDIASNDQNGKDTTTDNSSREKSTSDQVLSESKVDAITHFNGTQEDTIKNNVVDEHTNIEQDVTVKEQDETVAIKAQAIVIDVKTKKTETSVESDDLKTSEKHIVPEASITDQQQNITSNENGLTIIPEQSSSRDDIPSVIADITKDEFSQMENSTSKLPVIAQEDSAALGGTTEDDVSMINNIKEEITDASKADQTNNKDSILSDVFKTVHSLADKLMNGKESISSGSEVKIEALERKPNDDGIAEKTILSITSNGKDESVTKIDHPVKEFNLQTSDKSMKDEVNIEKVKRAEGVEKIACLTDDATSASKEITAEDSNSTVILEASEKKGIKEDNDLSKPKNEGLTSGKLVVKEEPDKSLNDESASATKKLVEKMIEHQDVTEDLSKKAPEVDMETNMVFSDERVDAKLTEVVENKMHELSSKEKSSLQGSELHLPCPQTSEATREEKFVLDSIISETPIDSEKISVPEEQLMPASEQTGLQKLEQSVEEKTFRPVEDEIRLLPEKRMHTKSHAHLTVSEESVEHDLTAMKLDETVNLTEDEAKEGKAETTIVEQYADVSIPVLSSFIDAMDDSDDSDSSSDISRKTTLTTRPYQTPRHHARELSQTEDVQTGESSDTQDISDKMEETFIVLDDKISLQNDKSIEQIDKSCVQLPLPREYLDKVDDNDSLFSEEQSTSMQIPVDQQKLVAAAGIGSSPEEKQTKSTNGTETDTKRSSTTKRLQDKKLGSETKQQDKTSGKNVTSSTGKLTKTDTFKVIDRRMKDRVISQTKKKASSEESSEEKASHSQDITSHSRYRTRKKPPEEQTRRKDSDQTKQFRRTDEEPRRKQSLSKSRSEKDKKSSSGSEKHSNPPKTGEIDTSKAQPKYMAWYKKNREEMEKKRAEMMATDDEEQLPRWLRRSMRSQKSEKEDKRVTKGQRTVGDTTPRSRRKVKPLVNVESEQLKAIVRQGRMLRKAEGGQNEDPPIQIFATSPPALPQTDPKHRLMQHSEYKYEKIPGPFYLHPPPAPHPSPEMSPEHFDIRQATEHVVAMEDFDPSIAVSLQGGNRLRHQQLLEKKSVFDIAYSEAAPSQLRSDSTTPPS